MLSHFDHVQGGGYSMETKILVSVIFILAIK